MKTCPECGFQNGDNAERCAECDAELRDISAREPSPAERDSPLEIVATFGDTIEASLLKDRLEEAGIEACIPEELDPSPFGNFPPLAHVTVRVAKKDLAAAKQIVAAPPPEPPA
jgi:hypothetical protein